MIARLPSTIGKMGYLYRFFDEKALAICGDRDEKSPSSILLGTVPDYQAFIHPTTAEEAARDGVNRKARRLLLLQGLQICCIIPSQAVAAA